MDWIEDGEEQVEILNEKKKKLKAFAKEDKTQEVRAQENGMTKKERKGERGREV